MVNIIKIFSFSKIPISENLEGIISNILLKHKSYVGIAPGAGEKNKIWALEK